MDSIDFVSVGRVLQLWNTGFDKNKVKFLRQGDIYAFILFIWFEQNAYIFKDCSLSLNLLWHRIMFMASILCSIDSCFFHGLLLLICTEIRQPCCILESSQGFVVYSFWVSFFPLCFGGCFILTLVLKDSSIWRVSLINFIFSINW